MKKFNGWGAGEGGVEGRNRCKADKKGIRGGEK
jgi:hypothetical protein